MKRSWCVRLTHSWCVRSKRSWSARSTTRLCVAILTSYLPSPIRILIWRFCGGVDFRLKCSWCVRLKRSWSARSKDRPPAARPAPPDVPLAPPPPDFMKYRQATSAHVSQSRQDYGLGLQVKVVRTLSVVPSSFGSDPSKRASFKCRSAQLRDEVDSIYDMFSL